MSINTAVSSEKYIEGLLAEIVRLKTRDLHTLYRINDKMTKPVSVAVSQYFSESPYTIEIKKCARCSNSYDIIITF